MFYVSPLTKVTFLPKKFLSFGAHWWVGVHCVFDVSVFTGKRKKKKEKTSLFLIRQNDTSLPAVSFILVCSRLVFIRFES